jgi:hypothetical protein
MGTGNEKVSRKRKNMLVMAQIVDDDTQDDECDELEEDEAEDTYFEILNEEVVCVLLGLTENMNIS